MFVKQLSMLAVCLFALGGCLADAGPDQNDDPAPGEATTEVQSALYFNWRDTASPPYWSNIAKAAASANGRTYFFYGDGWACEGSRTRVCDNSEYPYAVPGNVIKYLRGVGANAANQFFAWYEHGYYSVGDATNLGSIKGMTPFSAAPFKASQMIDAYNIPSTSQWDVYGGRWAFYWRDESNPKLVWRTVGKVSDVDYFESQKQVQIADPATYGPIVGIDYSPSTGGIWTYYAKGSLNSSLLPLNLNSLD